MFWLKMRILDARNQLVAQLLFKNICFLLPQGVSLKTLSFVITNQTLDVPIPFWKCLAFVATNLAGDFFEFLFETPDCWSRWKMSQLFPNSAKRSVFCSKVFF